MAGEQGILTPNREQTIIDIARESEDFAWKVLSASMEMDAPSGGFASFESNWSRSEIGSSIYLAQTTTSNKSVVTATVKDYAKTMQWLKGVLGSANEVWDGETTDQETIHVRVRYRVGDARDELNWSAMLVFYDVKQTDGSFNQMVADSTTGTGALMKQTAGISAGLSYRQKPITHTNITVATITEPQNKIIWLGGSKFVTAGDATITPAGTTYFTSNNGGSWTSDEISTFTNGNATDLTVSGRYVVYAGSADAPAYIDIDDLFTGSGTFTASSGISSNFPGFIDTCPNGRVWAVGAGGRVYRSDDSGITFTEAPFSATTTTQAITSIHAVSDNKVWCGLANGTILLISGLDNPTASVITTGSSDQIDAIKAHPVRKTLVFGTDAGTIFKTTDRTVQAPTFTQATFMNTGVGTIRALEWGSLYGEVLYIVQNNASPVGTVYRDLSGGALGTSQLEIPGGTAFSPTNAGLNDIAIAYTKDGLSSGTGLVIGEEVASEGYVGRIFSE